MEAGGNAMSEKTDTKWRLAQTLKTLCRTKKLEKITINELVKECGVNKSTFYYHFMDLDDLIQWIWKTDIEEKLMEPVPGYWRVNEEKKMRIWYDDDAFYRQAMQSDSINGLRRIYFNALYRMASKYISNICQGVDISDEARDFLARYQAHAFCDLHIDYFLTHPEEGDLEAFITMCFDTSEAWLKEIPAFAEKWKTTK